MMSTQDQQLHKGIAVGGTIAAVQYRLQKLAERVVEVPEPATTVA